MFADSPISVIQLSRWGQQIRKLALDIPEASGLYDDDHGRLRLHGWAAIPVLLRAFRVTRMQDSVDRSG